MKIHIQASPCRWRCLFTLLIGALLAPSLAAKEKEERTPLPTLKVALVRLPDADNPSTRLESHLRAIEEAAQLGARVVVFPEKSLMGEVAAVESSEGIQRIAETCGKASVHVILGALVEKEGQRLNRAIVIGPSGEMLTEYDAAGSGTDQSIQPDHRMAIFSVDGVPCSVLIGADIELPELARIPALGGAVVLFHLDVTANEHNPAREALLRVRALENGVFVVSCGRGASDALIGPSGDILENSVDRSEPGIVIGTIDPNQANTDLLKRSSEHPALAAFWREGLRVLKTQNRPYFRPQEKVQPKIRVASVAYVPVKWDKDCNMQRTEEFIRRAARENPDLIVLPEGVLEGYVIMEVDNAPPEKKAEMEAKFKQLAEPLDGPYIQRYRDLAKELSVMICFGFAERRGGEIYNSVALVGKDGEIEGLYSKTHLAQGYGHPDFYKTGKDFPSFETEHGRIGMVICYDRQLPEPARLVRLAGAQLILAPSYGSRGEWNDQLIRMRARENGVPMVFCHPNQALFVDAQGEVLANVTATDHVEICDVPLPAKETDRITLRRPDLYGGFLEGPLGK